MTEENRIVQENNEDISVTANKEKMEGSAANEASIMQPFNEIDRLIDQFLRRGLPSLRQWSDIGIISDQAFELEAPRAPNLDVIDRDDEILIRAEIPDIEKENLNISITGDLLTIKGHSMNEMEQEKGDYHKREISNSSFSRSVRLPGAIDASKAAASLKNGILEVNLSKEESSKPCTITVQ